VQLQSRDVMLSGIAASYIRCVEERTKWSLVDRVSHSLQPCLELWFVIFVLRPFPQVFWRLSIDVDGHLTAWRICWGRDGLSSSGAVFADAGLELGLQLGLRPKCILNPRLPLKKRWHDLHCKPGDLTWDWIGFNNESIFKESRESSNDTRHFFFEGTFAGCLGSGSLRFSMFFLLTAESLVKLMFSIVTWQLKLKVLYKWEVLISVKRVESRLLRLMLFFIDAAGLNISTLCSVWNILWSTQTKVVERVAKIYWVGAANLNAGVGDKYLSYVFLSVTPSTYHFPQTDMFITGNCYRAKIDAKSKWKSKKIKSDKIQERIR